MSKAPAPRPERVLFVHAHPDDETLSSGGTIATLLELGAEVTVLTATRGERGEMLTETLAPLFGDGPRVAAHRETEIAAALAALHYWWGVKQAKTAPTLLALGLAALLAARPLLQKTRSPRRRAGGTPRRRLDT